MEKHLQLCRQGENQEWTTNGKKSELTRKRIHFVCLWRNPQHSKSVQTLYASRLRLQPHTPSPPPPTPRLPSRSQLKVPLSRRFNNSHLAPICAPSRLCQSLKAWHGVLFLGQHFSPIVCSDDSLMKPWPSCAPFEVTSERRAALIRKPWDANTLHSGIPVAALREGGVFALRRRISS